MIKIIESPALKTVGKTSLKVFFDYNQEVIDIIKSANDALWNKKEKLWELPCTKLAYLINNLSYLDDIQLELMNTEDKSKLLPKLEYKTKPFEYQREGVEWLINHDNGLLLDVPGLGKSLQVIYAAEELKNQKNIEHCLVICGINTLKQNWKKEIQKHSNESCVIIGEKINSKGNISYTSVKERANQLFNKIDEFFVIVNIESIRDQLVIDAIINSENNFDMVVFDECHKVANPSSSQSKGLLKLSKVGKYHYGLTGTLLTNTPLNSFVPLKFIGEEKGTWSNFKSYYCQYEWKFGHQQIVGYKNINTLRDEINNCSLRRTKDLLDLPPKNIIPEYIEMSDAQAKFYNDISKGVVEEADRVNIKTTSLLGLVTRLRQASSCPSVLTTSDIDSCKIDRAIELVDEIVSNGEKVVIFSTFKEPVYKLQEALKKYKPLIGIGDLSDDEVSENIDKFQNDSSYKVFIATPAKCGTGITLNAASYGIFLDSSWTSALETQVEDRIHRVNNTKPVFIYKLIAKGTIDERVQNILDRKKGISDYIIDNKQTEQEELKELLGLC